MDLQQFQQQYLQKCTDYVCEPIQPFLEDLDAAKGGKLEVLRLNGNSKRLFNSRIQLSQVFALVDSVLEDQTSAVWCIDLSYNNLSDEAAGALSRLVQYSPVLTELNLKGNDIGGAGAIQLADALKRPSSNLSKLILSGNPLGGIGMVALAEMLKLNKTLKELHLGSCEGDEKGIIALCTSLAEHNTSLEVLDIEKPTYRAPQDSTAQHLARMLSCNSSLRVLNMAKHSLVDSGFDTLVGYGLVRNSTLNVLDLRANKLSGFAGASLERMLSENRSVTYLDLSCNSLGNDGAVTLARCLPYCHQLLSLDVRSNNIGEVGLSALAEALGLGSTLQRFLAWGNHFGPGCSRTFHEVLSQPNLAGLKTDLKTYIVDGKANVALLDVA